MREADLEVKRSKHLRGGALLEAEMWKSALHCGAKHLSKSKRAKYTILGALLEVQFLKKCTALWREDTRSTLRSQNAKNTALSEHDGALLEV